MKEIINKQYHSKPGEAVVIVGPKGIKTAVWGGHIKDLRWWQGKGHFYKLAIVATAFILDETTLSVPFGTYINAFGCKDDIWANGKKIHRAYAVKAQTRPPRNKFEQSLGNSWPVVQHPEHRSQLYEWSSHDILASNAQGELFQDDKPF